MSVGFPSPDPIVCDTTWVMGDANHAKAEHSVAVLLFDDVEVLDFAAPFEVFSVAGRRGDRDLFDVFTVAEHLGAVAARNGLLIMPRYSMAECPHASIVVIPGGFGSRREMRNSATIEWVRRMAGRADIVLSVCTGSLILAAAGLLGDLEATTHHGARDLLAFTEPRCRVVTRRVVDTGAIVSTAGVSAGLDGAFHVISRVAGMPIAIECASYMEYDWRAGPTTHAVAAAATT